jgi:hypothetical protein
MMLQIPLGKMPEIFLAPRRLSGLLPQFVGADSNLFVGRICHRKTPLNEAELRRASAHIPLKDFGRLMVPVT